MSLFRKAVGEVGLDWKRPEDLSASTTLKNLMREHQHTNGEVVIACSVSFPPFDAFRLIGFHCIRETVSRAPRRDRKRQVTNRWHPQAVAIEQTKRREKEGRRRKGQLRGSEPSLGKSAVRNRLFLLSTELTPSGTCSRSSGMRNVGMRIGKSRSSR